MSEWKECKLGDLLSYINRGISPSYVENDGLAVLNQKCIRNGVIDFEPSRLTSINKKIPLEKMLQQYDILINSTGVGTAGRVAILKDETKATVDSHVSIVRISKRIAEPKYIFYSLFGIESDIETFAEGSTGQIELGRERIREISILIPSLPEQRSIAGVLSSLDDKIDLLHQQNETLEDMAEALWRKMFVEDIETEWKVGKLGEFIKTTSGGTPSRSRQDYYENGNYKWVKSKELQGTFIIDTEEKITEEALNTSSAKLLPENSLLLAMYGATVGEHGILTEKATCNQAICALIPNENYPYTFIHLFLKMNKEEIINHAVGSAQQNISQIVIQNLDFFQPNHAIIQFHKIVEGYFEKIKSNIFHIRTLSRLRDTLLPKLMSGEVRVKM